MSDRFVCGCYFTSLPPTTSPSFNDGSFGSTRSRQYLPLLYSKSHTEILSSTSRTVLKQTFTNPSSTTDIKECIYTFPLYDGVSVVGFTCKIGDRTLTGVVKEKATAKKIWNDAVAKGETAGLLEQASEASDVFSTKLGNIPAAQSVIVEIVYIGELKSHETTGIRFTIPTKIAPRYGSGPQIDANSVVQAGGSGGGMEIIVDISMPDGTIIKAVESPSHPIAVSMGTLSTASDEQPVMCKASATLSQGSAALEKDFVLIIQSKEVGFPMAMLETHPTIPHHRALMATLVPKFSLAPTRNEIIFVADRSGSMGGWSIDMLRSAMKVLLKSMPTGIRFNICSFGSHHQFLWNKSRSYSEETLQQALDAVQDFDAAMGGTETYRALEATIRSRFPDMPLDIILLTDGDCWSQEETFKNVNQEVEKSKGHIRIFTLGIGNGVSHSFIEGIARAANGFSLAVQEGERFESSVTRLLRGALSPHITDYTLNVKYGEDDDGFELVEKITDGISLLLEEPVAKEGEETKTKTSLFDANVKEDTNLNVKEISLPDIPYPRLHQAPHKIPSLFPASRTTVYILMSPETIQKNPTSVVMRATSQEGPVELEIPVQILAYPSETIHQLAVRKAVQEMEEGRGWIFAAKDQKGVLVEERFPSCFDDLVKKEAVRLGEKFQVASKWCSFVAVANTNGGSGTETSPVILGQATGLVTEPSILKRLDTGDRPRALKKRSGPFASKSPGSGALFGGSKHVSSAASSQRAGDVQFGRSGGLFGNTNAPASQASFGVTSARSPALQRMGSAIGNLFGLNVSPVDQDLVGAPSQRSVDEPKGPTDWGAKTSIDKVLALIDFQKFEGSWHQDNKEIQEILGFVIPAVSEELAEAWTTLLVVLFLEMKNSGEEEIWAMVVEKARAWLGNSMDGNLDELEKKAKEVIESN